MSPKEITYEDALETLQENLPYTIQQKSKSDLEWHNVGDTIRGRSVAYDEMLEMKKECPDKKTQFRVLPKNEADKYREGIAIGRQLGPEPRERKPLLALPDRI